MMPNIMPVEDVERVSKFAPKNVSRKDGMKFMLPRPR